MGEATQLSDLGFRIEGFGSVRVWGFRGSRLGRTYPTQLISELGHVVQALRFRVSGLGFEEPSRNSSPIWGLSVWGFREFRG